MPADAGHRIYTPAFLRIYDVGVLWLYSNRVWRCPVPRLVELYSGQLRRRHLDVGPGTGYFLTRARLPGDFDLTLLDASPHALQHASRRLAQLQPAVVEADVRRPLPTTQRFDSVAMSYVLHCLPGPLPAKAGAVRNVADVLVHDGVLFGATILGERARHSRAGRAALRQLNRRGIFDNAADTEASLHTILAGCFEHVAVEIAGAAALFIARSPRPGPVG